MHDNLESVGGARPQGVTVPIIVVRTFHQGSGQMKEERKSLLHLFLASKLQDLETEFKNQRNQICWNCSSPMGSAVGMDEEDCP